MTFRRVDDVAIDGKRVLIRADLNVPVSEGKVTNDARIQASLATLQHCLARGAKVILMSHLGRPTAGSYEEKFSLAPVAERLSELLGSDVTLVKDWTSGFEIDLHRVCMIENLRFEHGETDNDAEFSRTLAQLCDVFVMDAFGTAHRAHASTAGITQYVNEVCAGFLMAGEINALSKIMHNPEKPLIAIVGGAKVSTKVDVLNRLSKIADSIIVGGGMANTLLLADGNEVGKSLVEPDFVDVIQAIKSGVRVLPLVDVMVGTSISASEPATLRLVDEVKQEEMVLDIGPESARRFAAEIERASTILWNGPMGVFEHLQYGEGTRVVASAIAESKGFSVAGGGDTLAAIDRYGVRGGIDYISTGGGAFLEFIEGRPLPGVISLEI